MSNIRGLRDIESNNRTPLINRSNENRVNPLVVITDSGKNPRDETLWYMLKLYLLSTVTWKSFGVMATLFFVMMFILQVALDGIDKSLARESLFPINWSGPLTSRFYNLFFLVREEHQYYRLVSSLTLHADFGHIFGNATTLIIWASLFRNVMTELKIGLFFFVSGNFKRNTRQHLLTGFWKSHECFSWRIYWNHGHNRSGNWISDLQLVPI